VTDLLDKFPPPLIDTYAFYGYDKATQGGFRYAKRSFSPAIDGPDVGCPPDDKQAVVVPYDNGDGVGPKRSTARASQWKDAHAKGGFVLENYGFKGMGHSCTGACVPVWDCVHNKLAGKPHSGC
jgi:hypothetical protein